MISGAHERRAAEIFAGYFSGAVRARLNHSAVSHPLGGRSGCCSFRRSFLACRSKRTLHQVRECVVEGIRAGTQTSCYIHATVPQKPSMTCGPVLKRLTPGMSQLEARPRAAAEQEKTARLQLAYPMPPLHEWRALTPQQKKRVDAYVVYGLPQATL